MKIHNSNKIFNFIAASIWLVNGLFCKVLNLVPRHQAIVEKVLESHYSRLLTILIGLLEIAMAIWILSRIKHHLNAIVQIVIIAAMNILEFFLAPDLLLWGKFNLVFATLFGFLIYYNAFVLNKISRNV